ncbi:MAG: WG repeat-containing protein [Bacteroidetes bacterium]|nr:WG repeat-containing protein [Bacteroidota bacterium]
MRIKKIAILLGCFYYLAGFGSTIDEANKALSIYDYFKAKKLFYKSLRKSPSDAGYGLSVIYYRTDNPFTNLDSAAKYIALSRQRFVAANTSQRAKRAAIDSMASLISTKGYDVYALSATVAGVEHYPRFFYFAPDSLKQRAIDRRDSMLFSVLSFYERSDSLVWFMEHYPESNWCTKARETYEYYVYREQVKTSSAPELKQFISRFPANRYRMKAEADLFQWVRGTHEPGEVYTFIKQYSTGLTSEQAWKYLYSISVKNYSEKELQNFLATYPDYPYKQSVEKEINLSATLLLPVRDLHDKWGYVDTLGHWVIAPRYDDANAFSEGFAAVCAGDSCFYIDKEGKRSSVFSFDETSDYINGVAVVKQSGHYYLINRTGQYVSQAYDEMNDPSSQLYVVKKNGHYGAINNKGAVVIPISYAKLGDFKNGFAYYVSDHYGLIDTLNKAYKAEWDWVSDVDTDRLAIVKKGNGYGVIHAPDQVILTPGFDYVKPCTQSVFLVVKQGLYGFYDAPGRCFISEPAYDYKPQFDPAYYSNGKLFKRVHEDEVALADVNGRVSIDYGRYEDIFFARDELIRIVKNQKFGFVDRKLKVIVNPELDKASDFEQDRAIVEKKDVSSLIDRSGKALFSCKNCELKPLGDYYLVQTGEQNGLLDHNGKYVLQPVYDEITELYRHYMTAREKDQLFLLNLQTGELKKL